jgi:hypothetical protein
MFERGRGTGSACRLVEHVCDGLGRERAAPEGIGDGGVEGRGAEAIEQPQEPGGRTSEVPAAQGDGVEERLGVRACGAEPVAPAKLVRVALVVGERAEVRRVFDDLVTAPGSRRRAARARSGLTMFISPAPTR